MWAPSLRSLTLNALSSRQYARKAHARFPGAPSCAVFVLRVMRCSQAKRSNLVPDAVHCSCTCVGTPMLSRRTWCSLACLAFLSPPALIAFSSRITGLARLPLITRLARLTCLALSSPPAFIAFSSRITGLALLSGLARLPLITRLSGLSCLSRLSLRSRWSCLCRCGVATADK
jgi:hypothetical protein